MQHNTTKLSVLELYPHGSWTGHLVFPSHPNTQEEEMVALSPLQFLWNAPLLTVLLGRNGHPVPGHLIAQSGWKERLSK